MPHYVFIDTTNDEIVFAVTAPNGWAAWQKFTMFVMLDRKPLMDRPASEFRIEVLRTAFAKND